MKTVISTTLKNGGEQEGQMMTGEIPGRYVDVQKGVGLSYADVSCNRAASLTIFNDYISIHDFFALSFNATPFAGKIRDHVTHDLKFAARVTSLHGIVLY